MFHTLHLYIGSNHFIIRKKYDGDKPDTILIKHIFRMGLPLDEEVWLKMYVKSCWSFPSKKEQIFAQ